MNNETTMLPVIGLRVENVQKIKFAEFTPGRNTVIVSGANGAGKSSLCNAMRLALGDKVASKLITKPISDGEDHASATVDLGKFKVTRTWNDKGKSTMKIESSDGAIYKTPAEMLKNMVGNLAFDPVEFSQMSEKEQVSVLLDLIELPINLDDLAEQRRDAYETRTLINRNIKRLEGQRDGMPFPSKDLPDEEIITSKIMLEYQVASNTLTENNRIRSVYRQSVENTTRRLAEIADIELKLQDLKADFDIHIQSAEEIKTECDKLEDPDLSVYRTQLETAEETNKKIRNKLARNQVLESIQTEQARSQEKTDEINAIDTLKADTIKAANMPIAGLSLDESGVTFNGIPLKQCSTSESLKVCCAIVISKMKKQTGDIIPVIIIKDGSLLDDNNMKVIEQIAIDEGLQFWIELVSTTGDQGIFIENGMIK